MTDNETNVTPLNRGRRFVTRAKIPRGESEYVGFRCAFSRIRQMDEIVGSRVYPELKTRSDILQDAVVFWLDNFYQENPDGPGAVRWGFHRREISRQMRDEEYESSVRVVKRAIQEKDWDLLDFSLVGMKLLRETFKREHASPVEMTQLNDLIKDAERSRKDHVE